MQLDFITLFSMILGLVLGLPLIAFGGMFITQKLATALKVKKGFIRCRFFLPNQREKIVMLKPTNKEFEFEDVKGKKMSYKFDETRITYDGNIPIATYRIDNPEQIDIKDKNYISQVDPSYFNELLRRAFNYGRLSVNPEKKGIDKIILILLGVVGLGVLFGVLNFNATQEILNILAGRV